jgi:endonuclease-3 related protein
VREKNLLVNEFYSTLYAHYGAQRWWPASSRFEVIVGAILTQNTNWKNVEKAIRNLKGAKLLNPKAIYSAANNDLAELALLIRPAGYFNVKAKRLKNFLDSLFDDFGGSLTKLFNREQDELRRVLLKVNGIGPETADSIILYAAEKPAFVIDAYTHRILRRHGLSTKGASYHELQELFLSSLTPDVQMFNEYHALIVMIGKDFCKTRAPLCKECPLEPYL